MEYEQIQVHKEGGVAVCTIYNPPENFMSDRMVREMSDFVKSVTGDDSVRVLVVTGGVEGIFITHFDVSALAGLGQQAAAPEPPRVTQIPLHRLERRLQDLPKPVIAAINGQCGGGGCEFAMACDLRIMAIGDFRIGQPEVNVGIIPGGGGTQRLPRLVGKGKALEMMLLGRMLKAEEAERIGLVNQAVPASEFMPSVMKLASKLARSAPVALGLIKRCLYEGLDLPLWDGLQVEFEAFMESLRDPSAQAAMKANLRGEEYRF
jgi:enoyl-CoA hydratase/carnithine racemase